MPGSLPELTDLLKRIRGCGYDRCVQEIDDYAAEVKKQIGTPVYKELVRLHENLGHPSRQRLTKHLEAAGYDDDYVVGAMFMVCKTCLQYRPPNPPPPSTLKKSLRFNETSSIDVFTWHVEDVSIPVVVLLDEATKFVQAREMKKNYTTRDLTDMIEETWISWAGMP